MKTKAIKLTVHVVRMFPQNALVQPLCFVVLKGRLQESGQVVGDGDRDGAVVLLVMLGLITGAL